MKNRFRRSWPGRHDEPQEAAPADDQAPASPAPADYQPSAPQPAEYQPPARQPADYQPPAPQPAAYQPPAPQPAAYQPPATYQPSAPQPATYQPSAPQPATYQPPAPQPTAYQPPAYQEAAPQPPSAETSAPVTEDEPPPAVDPWAAPPPAAEAVPPAPEPEAAAPVRPAGPADLDGNAPTIGRAAAPHLGQVNPATALRPPAVALDGTTAGDFQVSAASLIGAGHLVSGHPRQDAYNFMVGHSGRLYVAIADGLGSKPASQLGANLFTESVLIAAAQAELADPAAEPDPAVLLVQASARTARVVEEAYKLELRTVGFVGAVAVFSELGCRMARIGDVSAFVLIDGGFDEQFAADEGPLNLVSASMPGEKAEEIEVVDVPPAGVIAFGTDGFANDIRNSSALREWLAEQWQVPHLPFAIGDTLRYRRQGSHDDRTAVVVWRKDRDDEG